MERREFLQGSLGAMAAAPFFSRAEAAPGGASAILPSDGNIRLGAVSFRREEVAGYRGAVGAGNPLTAAAGARILAKGGNAVDAVIAAAFMAYVVEPGNAGLGGHGRLTVHLAKSKRTVGIDHYIRAPRGATPDAYRDALRRSGQDPTRIPDAGHLTVGVFGTVAGLCAAHERFASLPLPVLMEEAIATAEMGTPVDLSTLEMIVSRMNELDRFPRTREFLLPNGRVPELATDTTKVNGIWQRTGSRLDTTDLARTMKRIAKEGAAAIYRGSIAEKIDREMRNNNGLLTMDDLAACSPAIFDEPQWSYRDHVYTTCSDLLGPQFLNIAERFDLRSLDPNGADYRHLMAEALALAYTDGLYFPADPADKTAPREGLASKAYGEQQARRISLSKAIGRGRYSPGDPWPFETKVRRNAFVPGSVAEFTGTTTVTVGDSDGNMASLITSLASGFGSLVMIEGTGIILGNAMQWFDPRPGLSNSVGPGRMPPYVAPLMTVFREGRPTGAIAGAGGYRIATALFHSLVNRVDHRMSIQGALEHPRIQTMGQELLVDERIGSAVIEKLSERGHSIQVMPNVYETSIAHPTAVWRESDGSWHAASCPKMGGTAAV